MIELMVFDMAGARLDENWVLNYQTATGISVNEVTKSACPVSHFPMSDFDDHLHVRRTATTLPCADRNRE